jgi:hypothetical protein
VPPDLDARALLFVGPMNRPTHGGELLLSAVEEARRRGAGVELISISRPGEELPGEAPPWLHRERADGTEIDRFLPRVMASITPRRKSPYNDLSVPIKVLEYLGYGRPLIVTDTEETATIVREAGCGVVAPDTVDGLAAAIHTVATASVEQRAAWGQAARRAAEHNSWDERARQIIKILQPGSSAGSVASAGDDHREEPQQR